MSQNVYGVAIGIVNLPNQNMKHFMLGALVAIGMCIVWFCASNIGYYQCLEERNLYYLDTNFHDWLGKHRSIHSPNNK